ncbi:uncharacterized protein LOC105847055 isoform X2 [Hydra vulgaris]|uniref:uncharacterized protein LOC105847055 isoform X2 n=1 Tax=Hydra vulgaris TaxID=6087 RepID=UPI001F5FBBA2|nr:uncharacterized protein LOC105847055 isoform X2 [Hydra vulgaris]
MFLYFIILALLTNVVAQFSYRAHKSSSRYSFTVYKNKKVDDSTNMVEMRTDYNDYHGCIKACFNKGIMCKSMDAAIVDKKFTCRLFNDDFPKIQQAEGFMFISTKPPNCSQSCSLTLDLCGKCECNPSCAGRNRRQHSCNCRKAAGIAKSCQEHYDNGFTKTGIFQISPKDLVFDTLCEMEKFEHQNPQDICLFGCGIPSVFIESTGELRISSVINDNYDYVVRTSKIPFNQWSSIEISQTQSSGNYIYTVYLNGQTVTSVFNKKPQMFPNVNVYATHPWRNGAVGFIKDLKIINGNDTVDLLKVDGHMLIRDNLITSIQFLEKEYSVFLKLKLLKLSYQSWTNVIHLTTGGDNGKYGFRTPAIFISPNSPDKLQIASAINGSFNYVFYTQSLPLNEWSSIKVSQTQLNEKYIYTVYLNELLIFSIENTMPQSFSNVLVYAADPWNTAQDGLIKDFKITTGNNIVQLYKYAWIPIMTRFASWEPMFWDRTFQAYEDGFGLINQQWIGLKKLNQLTSVFFTDMRVDYFVSKDIKLSTIYHNVIVGSSNDKYVLTYDSYDPKGLIEPDQLNANGKKFLECSNWWTDICDKTIFPTSTNFISFGSNRELVSIQFLLRTKKYRA